MDVETARSAGPGRVLLGIVLLALGGIVAWVGLSALWHFPQPVYLLSPVRLLVTLSACAAALYGLRLVWELPRPFVSLAGLVVACLWAVSFVSFIGVLTLPVAALSTALLVGAARRGGGGAGEAVATGLLVAVALAVLLFASPWTAAVQCGDGAGRTSTRPFSGSNYVSGSGEVGGNGSRGMFSSGEVSYSYRCEGGELVEFRRVG